MALTGPPGARRVVRGPVAALETLDQHIIWQALARLFVGLGIASGSFGRYTASMPTWRRRTRSRVTRRCKRPDCSQFNAVRAARRPGPLGAVASKAFRTGAERPDCQGRLTYDLSDGRPLPGSLARNK